MKMQSVVSTKKRSQELHAEFEGHEQALHAKTKKRQKRHTDNVQLRLLARLKVRQSKAMSKVPMFKELPPDAIEAILERTSMENMKMAKCCVSKVILPIIFTLLCLVTAVYMLLKVKLSSVLDRYENWNFLVKESLCQVVLVMILVHEEMQQ